MTRAEKMIAFIETLRTPDGAGVGQPFVLRGWQKAIIREVYDAEDGEGRRVVRQAVLSMSRKNGKTALVAGCPHLCGPEAVRNGQLYSLAHDREQASVLFKLMTAMIYMDEELSERLNVVESRKRLVDPVSGSEFTALSSETRGKHGKSSSFIVFDELAQFGADRELYDVMMTSRGVHADPLVWCISTQAASDNAVLSELIDYGQKVNRGEIEDPKFKTFLFSVPMDADPWDEANWYLANPALGDFRSLEDMREMAEKAKRMPAAEAAFVTSISTSAWTARRISSPRKSGGGAAGNRIWRCLRICPCSVDSICPERTTLPR
ncbi:MAG: terminase large subunit domain-containing protein [Bilophila wadsworthia]